MVPFFVKDEVAISAGCRTITVDLVYKTNVPRCYKALVDSSRKEFRPSIASAPSCMLTKEACMHSEKIRDAVFF